MAKTNINKLKESFDFLQYLQERYGFKTAAEGGAQVIRPCPICGCEDGSCKYFTDSRYFICHNCGTSGDVLAFLQKADRLSERQAEERFRKLCADDIAITALSDIESTQTEWLWYPYIPRGKITLLTADPGTGKTFFCLYLAAAVSCGRPFYGSGMPYTEPQRVLYQTAEDGIADTIKPRLEPMQPNFGNIMVISEDQSQLSLSDERIERIMRRYRPALMIFDPLQAYLGADVDMHRANEVRPVLSHISHLAEKYRCAVVFIMHNSKMSQNQALYRALGSIDIPAVARSMLVMGKNPENPSQKVLCHEKSSLARHGQSILFEVAPERGGILFQGFTHLTADDVLSGRRETREKPSVTKDAAREALLKLFGDGESVELSEVKELMEEMGCSRRTMYNLKRELELQNFSVGFADDKKTYWLLPEVDKNEFNKRFETANKSAHS